MLAFTAPSPVPVTGRVVRVLGHDTVVVVGARVTLHRVTAKIPGPVDSLLSNAAGRFTFRVAPDSGIVYLVSARWDGIEYFAAPFVVPVEPPAPALTIVASDTSSTITVTLAARHLIVSPPAPDGTRQVVDLFVLDNPGPRTRVPVVATAPTWEARLPRFAMNAHAGTSDFAEESVRFYGDQVALFAAIPPGRRDVEVDYDVPVNSVRFELPVDADAPVSNIISADKSLRVDGAFTRSDTSIDNKPYARWKGRMTAGQPVVLVFGRTGVPGWLIPVMVAVMALLLVGVTVRALR